MDRVMIDERPEIVDKRERIWDWEWDTIIWKSWTSKHCLLTDLERKTWFYFVILYVIKLEIVY